MYNVCPLCMVGAVSSLAAALVHFSACMCCSTYVPPCNIVPVLAFFGAYALCSTGIKALCACTWFNSVTGHLHRDLVHVVIVAPTTVSWLVPIGTAQA